MEKYINVILNSKLFSEMKEEEASSMIKCLSARKKAVKKGEYIYRVGEKTHEAAMVLEGAVHIEREDYWGNKSIIAEITAGEMLGETYACAGGEPVSVNAVAARDTILLMMNMKKVFSVCSPVCPYHTRLIENFVHVLASKNIELTRKMEHISHRTTRGKLISYLSEQSVKNGSASFTIPFDRQQLADFLSVDRSALSRELSRMRREGVLDFEKNRFTLKSMD